jgi:hypothetical protein
MAHPQLRVYLGPDSAGCTTAVATQESPAPTVSVPLGEVLPLLADAVRSHRTWLTDFEDDEISISADLYEVLLAYRHFRPSA